LPKHVAALGAKLLAIEAAHVLRLESLPLHHRDPFGRMLHRAKPGGEHAAIEAATKLLEPYGADVRW